MLRRMVSESRAHVDGFDVGSSLRRHRLECPFPPSHYYLLI